TSGRADRFLVVKPGGVADLAQLRLVLSAGFSVHLRLCVHLDPLHPQSDYSPSARRSTPDLPHLCDELPATLELLPGLRREPDPRFSTSRTLRLSKRPANFSRNRSCRRKEADMFERRFTCGSSPPPHVGGYDYETRFPPTFSGRG